MHCKLGDVRLFWIEIGCFAIKKKKKENSNHNAICVMQQIMRIKITMKIKIMKISHRFDHAFKFKKGNRNDTEQKIERKQQRNEIKREKKKKHTFS